MIKADVEGGMISKVMNRFGPLLHPIRRAYRRGRDWTQRSDIARAVYRNFFERRRLLLAEVAPELVAESAENILLPIQYPLFAGEDAPLIDLLFILNAAKSRGARRILEVGTYRARTTYAFHMNCPQSTIVSYDIQVLPSIYRTKLASQENVALRHGSFVEAKDSLLQEGRYDLIFIDGSHEVRDVIADSQLAFQILAPNGLIVWHDYRHNGYHTAELRVPEGLSKLSYAERIFHVSGTTCAVFQEACF